MRLDAQVKKTANKIGNIVNVNFQVSVQLCLLIKIENMFEHRKFLLYIRIFSSENLLLNQGCLSLLIAS